MSDEIASGEETASAPSTEQTQSAAPSNEETAGKLFFGKYKSIEDAERSFKELEKTLGHQANEIGEYRQKIADVQEKNLLAETLARLNQPKEKAPIDYEAFSEELAAEISENPSKAIKKLLGVSAGWSREAESSVKSEVEKRLKAIEETYSKKVSELEEVTEKLQPDYLENKSVIELFTSKGMSIKQAKQLAKQVKQELGVKDEGIKPPTTITSNRSSSAGTIDKYLTDDDRARMMRSGLTKEDLDMMEREEIERRKRNR